MSYNKNPELFNIIVYLLVGVSGFVVALIGVIYNLIWKNIKDLWIHKNNHEEKIQDNSENIAKIEVRCEERSKGKIKK